MWVSCVRLRPESICVEVSCILLPHQYWDQCLNQQCVSALETESPGKCCLEEHNSIDLGRPTIIPPPIISVTFMYSDAATGYCSMMMADYFLRFLCSSTDIGCIYNELIISSSVLCFAPSDLLAALSVSRLVMSTLEKSVWDQKLEKGSKMEAALFYSHTRL